MSVSGRAAAEGMSWLKAARLAGSLLLGAAAVLLAARGGWWAAFAAGIFAGLAVAVAAGRRLDDRSGWWSPVAIAALGFLLAWSVNDTMRVWQAPPTWHEALAFSPLGGGLALLLLLGSSIASLAGRGRPLAWREALAIFLLPYLFTSLFLLSAAHLLADLGRFVGIGAWFGWYGEATFGRVLLLLLFNEIVVIGGGWLMDGRWLKFDLAGAMRKRPYTGFVMMGYDNFKQTYVYTQVTNMDTAMIRTEGRTDPATKSIVTYGTLDEYLTGEHDKALKIIWRFPSADSLMLEVHDLAIGAPGGCPRRRRRARPRRARLRRGHPRRPPPASARCSP